METIKLNKEELAQIFTTWDTRYRENPEEFMSVAEHLLHNTPYNYGKHCAEYVFKLAEELL